MNRLFEQKRASVQLQKELSISTFYSAGKEKPCGLGQLGGESRAGRTKMESDHGKGVPSVLWIRDNLQPPVRLIACFGEDGDDVTGVDQNGFRHYFPNPSKSSGFVLRSAGNSLEQPIRRWRRASSRQVNGRGRFAK
jgi:hypothetical protein